MNENNYIKNRIKSFLFAFHGLGHLLRFEQNAQIHLTATVLAIISGLLLKISKTEWCIILLSIGLVWLAETANTAVEKIVDQIFPEVNEKAKIIKDISAAAVLICSFVALINGLIIFVPKLF